MKPETYEVEAAIEENHWWFVGRRKLFMQEISRVGIASSARVLDAGTSTGSNLRMLREMGFHHYVGLDMSEYAISYCRSKGFSEVHKGDICAMPFEDSTFDLVLATDIVEHVADDSQAAREIERVLKPGGYCLVTVPAFQSLWGIQDVQSLHKRRYRMHSLLLLFQQAGLTPTRSYHFNYLLFLPIWLARRIIGMLNIELRSENELNNRLLNSILSAIFSVDIFTAPVFHVPFGVSIFSLFRKTSGGRE